VGLDGNVSATWSRDEVGARGVMTDWERFHRPAGAEESGGSFTVTGSGDIAPGADGPTIGCTLIGTLPGLIVMIIVAAAYASAVDRCGRVQPMPRHPQILAAKAIVIGAVSFTAGLAAATVAVWLGKQILLANRVPVVPVRAFTELRIVIGTAALFAVTAVLAFALGAM